MERPDPLKTFFYDVGFINSKRFSVLYQFSSVFIQVFFCFFKSRKDCLKLLKHLLHLLKENNSSFAKFCSYHAKTTLLHACCSRTRDSEWAASDLNRCFDLLLQDFESHLRRGQLYNFFIPSQNLLSGLAKTPCKNLADCVKEQREKGFPIFVNDLPNP